MPPVVSMSSEEIDDDVAFKVLNQDNLPISVIGESIVKPFGRENLKQKPNGIVLPTRRIEANYEPKNYLTKSNGHIDNIQNQNGFNSKKNLSYSHNNLNQINKNKSQQDFVDPKFTKILDYKLRKLQKDEKIHQYVKNKQSDVNVSRKPFVTTVKKGQFLEPPPEIASLIGIKVEESTIKKEKDEKKLYAYASKPRVLNRTPGKNLHRFKCEAAKAAAYVSGSVPEQFHDDVVFNNAHNNSFNKKIADVMPYANLMFEKRVFRGSNFAPPPCHVGDGESAAARAAEARRRAMARRKAKNQTVRSSELRLRSPPPVPGRKHEPAQTELYLEELFIEPIVTDICTQTDLFFERPISPYYVPAKTGRDMETQIYPGDLFDFDMEVQPILEVLVGKTIEQALIEVLEEEELAALREQQRRFLELRAAENMEMQRLEERERRLAYEKKLRMADYEEGLRIEKEMEERIAASVLMQGYICDLLPSVLEGLESEGYLMDSIKEDIDEAFMPWLMKEVTHEMQEMVSSRDILSDIVREILENRAEIYRALNQSVAPGSDEEECPTVVDFDLREHLKLKREIEKNKENDLN